MAIKHLVLMLVVSTLSACISTKLKKGDQYLLAPPIVKGNKILPAEDFAYMHRQKPNTKFLFWSKAAIYQVGEKRHKPDEVQLKIDQVEEKWNNYILTAYNEGDSLKAQRYIDKQKNKKTKLLRNKTEGNWLMRVVGQKPVFFDSSATVRTAIEMSKLLKTKGFFQGQVSYEVIIPAPMHKRAIYTITENLPTYLDSVLYVTGSPAIDSLIKQHHTEKHLKKGAYYNTSDLDSERYRIEQLLRNNGYMFFSRQYINFEVDTTHFTTFATFHHTNYTEAQQDSLRKAKREARLKVIIENPEEGEHEPYKVDAVYMHQIVPRKKHLEPDTLLSRESKIHYIYVGKTLRHEHHVLDKRIRLRPTELYSSQKIIDTQNSLNLLDMYKFVNVKTDTIGNKLHLHIFSSSLDRYQLTFEGGANVAQGIPGPTANLSLKNRNVFGGAELFETSLRFLLDGQVSATGTGKGVYTTREIGGNVSLSFPRILFPSPLMPRGLRRNVYSYNPTTKLNLSYVATRRPEYTRSTLAGSISYKGQLKRATYNLTLAEISVINTSRLEKAFEDTLIFYASQGNPLKFSFGDAIVGSTYFTYTYNSTTDIRSKNSYYFRILAEVGGNTMRFLDKQFNKYNNDTILGLPYFQFYRINPSFHYYIPRPHKRFWAFRVNAGVAIPYGRSAVLPYEKYFFAGGSSSIRAWLTRRIGQGGVSGQYDSDGRPIKASKAIEKPGEIIIEANAEYRFPLYQGWIEGATFIDMGNVWNIREDPTTKGGKFDLKKIHEQIAIGTGFGIRMDFSFILFRTDIGLKVHDPAREEGSRWVLFKYAPSRYFNQRLFNFNIAIGYPF